MPAILPRWAARYLNGTSRKLAGRAVSNEQAQKQIREEAAEAGATLFHLEGGDLDPELALRVFRRDGWCCQVPGCETAQEDLDLDHIGGHPLEIADDPEASAWLKEQAAKGRRSTEDGLHVLCRRHHDAVHARERELQQDGTPKPLAET